MDEDAAETRWLTYAELAAARGISRNSAVRVAKRRNWPRRKGNDGSARVAVPVAFIEARRGVAEDSHPDDPGGNHGGESTAIKVLEEQVADLRKRLDESETAYRALVEKVADRLVDRPERRPWWRRWRRG